MVLLTDPRHPYRKHDIKTLEKMQESLTIVIGKLKAYIPTPDEYDEHKKLITIKGRELSAITEQVEEFRKNERAEAVRKEIIRKAMMN